MIAHTGSYAIRAVAYLVQAQVRGSFERNVTAGEIAHATGIPHSYLTKILCELVRVGTLESTRGPHGGFRLAPGAGESTLAAPLAQFEALPHPTCFLCPEGCPGGADCPNHERCLTLTGQVEGFLRNTRVIDLVSGAAEEGGVRMGTDERGLSTPGD